MKSILVLAVSLVFNFAHAASECEYEALRGFAAAMLLDPALNMPQDGLTALEETTVLGGEGEQVPVVHYTALVGDVTSVTVSLFKNTCIPINVAIEHGE